MTRPFNTATPDKAINPTPAEIDKGMPRNHKAKTPPVNAKGIPVNTKRASLTLPKLINSNRKMPNKVIGTTICKRWEADCNCSNCPPQVTQ
ncbi:Uncharacterised protein [Legionella pneumophila]|nr:Uncharacterised protein [Legionella pneumophila]